MRAVRFSRRELGQPKREEITITVDAALLVALRECARLREMELDDLIAEHLCNAAVEQSQDFCGVPLAALLTRLTEATRA